MNDFIIIGCGLSGLYLGNKLNKKGYKVLLFDKRERIGGRIISIKNKNNDIYDVGAVKIPSDHIRINKLVSRLNLHHDKLEVNKKIKYIIKDKTKYKGKEILKNLIIKAKKSKINLNSRTGYQVAEELYNSKYSKDIVSMNGYNGNFEKFNFKAYIKYRGNINRKYYILENGLSQICNKLISEQNLNINLESILLDYTYNNKIFTVKIEKNNSIKKYNCKKLILAIPQEALQDLFLNTSNNIYEKNYIEPLLSSVISNNYMRIFATYPLKDGKAWFHNISDIHSDKIIRKTSIYNQNKGIMQISYSDSRFADYWQNYLLNNSTNTYDTLLNYLKEIYPKHNIPKPTDISYHYWKNGTHYWLPNINISKIHNKLLKPFKYPLYICGEAYSNYQAWMEGALETADKVFNLILKKTNKIKNTPRSKNTSTSKKKQQYYTLTEVSKHNKEHDGWLIYNNKVYNVTTFIKKHPGSLAILKGLGKDATNIFDKIGHSNRARNIMRKYYIGELKGTK